MVARAGLGGRIASSRSATGSPVGPDVLLSRGLPGDGHIDLPAVGSTVQGTGYRGDIEVEVPTRRCGAPIRRMWRSGPRPPSSRRLGSGLRSAETSAAINGGVASAHRVRVLQVIVV